MAVEGIYDELIDKLNRWPIRVPKTKTLYRLLKEIFTPEEAYLLTKFNAPLTDKATVQDLIERIDDPNYDEKKVEKLAMDLSNRGMLYRFTHRRTGELYFRMLPMVIGIFEFIFSFPQKHSDEELTKLAKMFRRYFYEGFGLESGASDYPWSRVFPHDKARLETSVEGKEIIIDKVIPSKNVILAHDEVKTIIEQAKVLAVMPCSCRLEAKYSGHPCEHSIETCMVFDPYLVEIGMAKEITKEEALKLLHKCEKEGLVHISNNSQKGHFWICNCCSCSCGIMAGLTKLGNTKAFAKSNFVAAIDGSKECKECMVCVELCPMHAIKRWPAHDDLDELWEIDIDKCIGCGVCSSNCPTKRITLVKIREDDVEEQMTMAWMRSEAERFR